MTISIWFFARWRWRLFCTLHTRMDHNSPKTNRFCEWKVKEALDFTQFFMKSLLNYFISIYGNIIRLRENRKDSRVPALHHSHSFKQYHIEQSSDLSCDYGSSLILDIEGWRQHLAWSISKQINAIWPHSYALFKGNVFVLFTKDQGFINLCQGVSEWQLSHKPHIPLMWLSGSLNWLFFVGVYLWD